MKSITVSMIAAVAGLMFAGSALAAKMPALAKKSGCTACHKIEKKLVGPAWRDVSKAYNKVGETGTPLNPKKYKASKKVKDILAENKAKNAEAWLIQKVSKGGNGNWGKLKMTPNSPKVSDADIKKLVQFVLGLEK